MEIRRLSVLVALTLTCACAGPALAGVSPYVRLDYGASEFRMSTVDDNINNTETSYYQQGMQTEFAKVGSGYGPGIAVGAWILPGFRVGVTYSSHRAVRENVAYSPADSLIHYDDLLAYRVSDYGAEAAVRFVSLAGLTLGVNVAHTSADYSDKLYDGDVTVPFADQTSTGSKLTYGAFVGIDQTNANGLAGFVRAGFQFRDMGHMNATTISSNGVTSTRAATKTPWLDFSGAYVQVGVGFDLVR